MLFPRQGLLVTAAIVGTALFGSLACSGSDSGNDITPPGVGAGGGGLGGAGAGATAGSGAAGLGGVGGTTPSSGVPTTFGTYIELGDSISDGGGKGPFFYDLLYQNDDAKYPAWAGKDLKTRFNVQKHVHGSKGGATSQNMKAQVDALPSDLPGPVFVSVTIGGNDMQKYALDILQGKDEQDKAAFRQNLAKYLDALKAPGRFGDGVEVFVFAADIYDPSDGAGDFKNYCGGVLGAFPITPTDGFWAAWNGIVTEETTQRGYQVLPLHATFMGHGISHTADGTGWFVADCIHPNTVGHNEIRKMYWKALTDETVQ